MGEWSGPPPTAKTVSANCPHAYSYLVRTVLHHAGFHMNFAEPLENLHLGNWCTQDPGFRGVIILIDWNFQSRTSGFMIHLRRYYTAYDATAYSLSGNV